MKTEIFILPDWSLSYLINSDASGLEQEDINKIDNFVNDMLKEYKSFIVTMPNNEEPYFSYYNDIDNLGTNVFECPVIVE